MLSGPHLRCSSRLDITCAWYPTAGANNFNCTAVAAATALLRVYVAVVRAYHATAVYYTLYVSLCTTTRFPTGMNVFDLEISGVSQVEKGEHRHRRSYCNVYERCEVRRCCTAAAAAAVPLLLYARVLSKIRESVGWNRPSLRSAWHTRIPGNTHTRTHRSAVRSRHTKTKTLKYG